MVTLNPRNKPHVILEKAGCLKNIIQERYKETAIKSLKNECFKKYLFQVLTPRKRSLYSNYPHN